METWSICGWKRLPNQSQQVQVDIRPSRARAPDKTHDIMPACMLERLLQHTWLALANRLTASCNHG